MGKIRVLQLGASEVLVHTIRVLQRAGYEVFAVDRNPEAPGLAVADHAAPIDFGDVDPLTQHARAIRADVLLAVNEPGVLPAAEASRRLGLPNITPEVALQNLDKGAMRDLWTQAGLPQPEYRTVATAEGIPDAAQDIGFPVVIKPRRGWGSRGVSLVETANDLEWSIAFAREYAGNGGFVVERRVVGTEMTVEGLVQHGRPQVLAKSDKEHQDHPRYRVAMALNYPANFSPEILREADGVVGSAVEALGHRDGAFHAECMVTDDGVYLLESAARGGGGYVFSGIVEAVSGVCMPAATIELLLGNSVDILPRFQRGACYKFFSPPEGIFREVHGVDEAGTLPGIIDLRFSLEPGESVTPVVQDADRPGLVVSSGATRDEAIANADRAIARITYTMV